jgi:WD40 repeat protein
MTCRSRPITGGYLGRSEMADLFFSYSRADSEYVVRLADDLRERGKEVWIDTEGLTDAEVFPQALRSAIEGADVFVAIISPESVSSRFCQTEVSHAEQLGKRIVPVLLRPVDDALLPSAIRDRNWIPAERADTAARVARAADTDLEHVRTHTRWTTRAVEWEHQNRDRSLLPRGSELAAGETWLAGCASDADPAPTALQRELVYRGRRVQSTRQRRLLGVAVGTLVVALALLVFALIARQSADEQRRSAERQRTTAQAQALAARSDAAIAVSPLAALHLARAAVLIQASDNSLRTLKQAEDAQSLTGVPPSVRSRDGCETAWPAYRPATHELGLGSCDGKVEVVDAVTGRRLRTLRFGGDASTIAYRPDGAELAVLERGELLLADPVSGAVRTRLRIPGGTLPPYLITSIAYSPTGRRLAIVAGQQAIVVNEQTHRVRLLLRQRGGFGGIAFADDGTEIVTSDQTSNVSGFLAVFAADTGRELRRIPLPSHDRPGPLTASPDGRRVAVDVIHDGASSFARVWDASSWKSTGTCCQLADDFADGLQYAPDGTQLIAGTYLNRVDVFPASGGEQNFSARMTDTVRAVAARSRGLVAAIDHSGVSRVWRTSGAARAVLPAVAGYQDVAASGDTIEVASARPDGTGTVINFYSRDGRRLAHPLIVARDGLRTDDISSDGRLLIDAESGKRARATVWDIRRRRVLQRLPLLNIGFEKSYGQRILVAEGTPIVAAGAFTSIQVYDTASRRLGPRMNAALTPRCIGVDADMSTDGTRAIVTDTCGDLGIYDATTGRLLRQARLPAPVAIDGISLSRDGRWIAVFYPSGQGQIRSAGALDVRANLVGHAGNALALGFARSDQWVVTVGDDHTMRVWGTSDGRLIRTLQTPEALDYGAILSDGAVAAVSAGARTYVYDLCQFCDDTSALLRRAEPALRLPLTAVDRAIIQNR